VKAVARSEARRRIVPDQAARVLDVVEAIPVGRVLSYGDIKEYVGLSSARTVGAVMSRYGDEVPWHRVVYSDGRPAGCHGGEVLARLREEGVPLRGDRVNMAAARWDGR
jgi:alkylated DNA nucleotide flippase Atl1